MHWLTEIGRALTMGAMMGWQMLWALILGFGLSAVVQATVSREKIAKLMPDGGPRSIAIATGLGAASSSCSYAAVAIAHALSQGRGFSCGDGVRVCFDQPGF